MQIKYSVDISDLILSSYYNGPRVFAVPRPGSLLGSFETIAASITNWKSDTGSGQYRFAFQADDQYYHGPNITFSAVYPSEAQKPWIYDVQIDYDATYETNTWKVVFSVTVIGPDNGSYVTNSSSASFYPTRIEGFNSFTTGYYLGGITTGVQTDSVIKFKSFSSELILPPEPTPPGTCIIIQ